MEPNQCTPLLEQGIYTTLNITKTGQFLYDLKKYYESEQFKNDFKAQKFTLGVETFDPKTLVKNTLNLGASDDEINEFQLKIKSSEKISISQSFYDNYTLKTPNKDVLQAYVECMRIQNGLKGLSTIIQEGESTITIYIQYNKIAVTDPSPIVENYAVTNAIEIGKSFEIGKELDINNSITLKRVSADEEVFFFLDTNKGPVNTLIKGLPSGFNKDFPVGTIITSYLSWEEFQNVTKNNFNNPDKGIWNSKFSKWSPCDGRAIDNTSALSRASVNLTNVPDLRGVFLRGNNKFDDKENQIGISEVNSLQKDPENNRLRGKVQLDEYKEHFHIGSQKYEQIVHDGGLWDDYGKIIDFVDGDGAQKGRTSSSGGLETRPKNVSINYYIRIN
jgi:hypothetical protein